MTYFDLMVDQLLQTRN